MSRFFFGEYIITSFIEAIVSIATLIAAIDILIKYAVYMTKAKTNEEEHKESEKDSEPK